MTRNAAVTVRFPGAKMAPTSRTLAHSHTCSRKTSSKCRRTVIMAGGRSRMVQSFLVIGSESSVPCLSLFVYQMDKVELILQRRVYETLAQVDHNKRHG